MKMKKKKAQGQTIQRVRSMSSDIECDITDSL